MSEFSPDELETRRKTINSSEVGSILGLNPYRTPTDVWMEKTGRVQASARGRSVEIGTLMEDGLVREAGLRLNSKMYQRQKVVAANFGSVGFRASLDAWFAQPNVIVEAKTAQIQFRDEASRDAWGEDGTGEIPIYYEAQCQFQLMVAAHAGLSPKRVLMPAFLGWRGLVFYEILPDAAVQQKLIETLSAWWNDYVVKNVRPPETPSWEVARAVQPSDGKTAEIDPLLFEAYRGACKEHAMASSAERQIEARKKEIEAKIIASLDDAAIGVVDGVPAIERKVISRSAYTVESGSYVRTRILKGK